MADKMAVLVMVVMLGALALKALAWQSGRARTGTPERPTPARRHMDETTAIDNVSAAGHCSEKATIATGSEFVRVD